MQSAYEICSSQEAMEEGSNSTSLKRMVSSTKRQDYIQWETQDLWQADLLDGSLHVGAAS